MVLFLVLSLLTPSFQISIAIVFPQYLINARLGFAWQWRWSWGDDTTPAVWNFTMAGKKYRDLISKFIESLA
jgi:hypothetical protein